MNRESAKEILINERARRIKKEVDSGQRKLESGKC
jgi:hypothetical protein